MARLLIEREAQLSVGTAALERALSGAGGLLVVEGLAGTGKTRLLGELSARGREQGATVLAARGGELEVDVTYGIARQLFERLLHDAPAEEQERLLSGAAKLAQAAVASEADVVFSPQSGVDHGLYWLVANIEAEGPLVVLVDDAQWADSASVRFLLYLARRVESLRVLVMLGIRTGEEPSDPGLIRHLRAQAAARIVVEPLSERGSEQLLRGRFDGTLPAAAIEACHRVSGGNPFFLGEVAAEVAGSGADERALLERINALVPDTVRLSILLRLERLGDRPRQLAEAMAIAGEGTSARMLGEIAGLDAAAVASTLHELAEAGIAAPREPPEFVHPVIRTAVYTDIAHGRRDALHAASARTLAAHGAPVEQVAHHLAQTTPRGDPAVAATLRDAAERTLLRGAADAATAIFERALAEPPAPEELASVLVGLGEASTRAGAHAGAIAHLTRALELRPDSALTVRTAVTLALAYASQSRFDDAFDVLAREGARLGGASQLRLDAERTLLLNWIRDSTLPDWSDELFARFAQLEGSSPEERYALVQASLNATFDRSSRGESAAALARRALGDGALAAEFPVDSVAGAQPVYVLLMAEDFAAAERELAALFARARASGSLTEVLLATTIEAQISWALGRLGSSAAHYEAMLELSVGDSPIAHRSLAFACTWLTEVLLARGQVDAAREVIANMDAIDAFTRPELVWARAGRGFLRLHVERDADGAAADILAFGEAALAGGYEERVAPWRLWAATALAAAGMTDRAVALADDQLEMCTAWGTPGGLGMAQRVRATVGERDDTALLEQAVESLRASEMRYQLARALFDLGRSLRREGQRVRSRAALEEAMELAARSEAAPLVADARAELIVLGARPRRAMFSGIDALTAAERRVAEMAAGGLSNREIAQALFVTEKTVETHLHKVFRKLDISSRRDLPAELAPA